jgi:tetratricopeptide (TPR) repeat protein
MNSIYPRQAVSEETLRSDITMIEKEIGKTKEKKRKQELLRSLNDRIKGLGWLLCANGNFAEGLVVFSSLSWETHGEHKFVGLSMSLTKMGRFDDAIETVQKGLLKFPNSWALWHNAGNIYHEKKDYNSSLKYYEKALWLNKDNHTLLSKGNALYGLGLYEDALQIFKGLVSGDESTMHSLVMCGYCYLNTGYPEEASGFFMKALLCQDAGDDCYHGLYWSYIELVMLEDAIGVVEEGLAKFPLEGPDLYIDLGDAYYRKGWVEESKTILEKGAKLFPDNETVKEMLEILNDEINNPDAGNKPPTEGCIIVLMKERHTSRRKGDGKNNN